MKTFKIALWTVVATLWALPVAAQSLLLTTPTSFDTQIGFEVNPATNPVELDGAAFESIWSVRDSAELNLFEAADYTLDFELTNASLDATAGSITITVYNDSGSVITSNSSYNYVIDDMVVPHRLAFDTTDSSISDANTFVNNLSANGAAVQVVLRPDVEASMLDTDQEVRIQSQWRWNDTLVAIDDAKMPVF